MQQTTPYIRKCRANFQSDSDIGQTVRQSLHTLAHFYNNSRLVEKIHNNNKIIFILKQRVIAKTPTYLLVFGYSKLVCILYLIGLGLVYRFTAYPLRYRHPLITLWTSDSCFVILSKFNQRPSILSFDYKLLILCYKNSLISS